MVFLISNAEISDEFICFLNCEHSEVLFAEEIIHDGAVSSQKVECHWMVQFNCLTYIDHVDEVVVPEQIIFAKISMDQLSLLEHPSNGKQCLFISVLPVFNTCVFQPWGCIAVFADKVHQNNVVLENVRNWAFYCIDK